MGSRAVDRLIDFLTEQGFISSISYREEMSDEERLSAALSRLQENVHYGKSFRQIQSLHDLIPSGGSGYREAGAAVEKKALELFPASSSLLISCEDTDCDEACLSHLGDNVSKHSFHQALVSKGYFPWATKDESLLAMALKSGNEISHILLLRGEKPDLAAAPFVKLASLFSFFASAALNRGRAYDLLQQTTDRDFKKQFEEEHEKLKKTENLVLLSQFTVGLNHEINNPLAVIKGALYLMRKSEAAGKDDTVLKNIGRIEEAVSAISEIVQNLENLKRKYKIKEYLKDVHMVDFSMDKPKEEKK
ncbi:MAG TPA: histidine kinase dimerization/phospho-acceptor domain-containing protein [Candidatus Mcinerneyibacteriales bacterium]|nr:histidine kinase dimerization/phospho-acceptor domain-containing protein [Candidatus Mcinerneyibacteriales bacterium]